LADAKPPAITVIDNQEMSDKLLGDETSEVNISVQKKKKKKKKANLQLIQSEF
jgi:hypothetical protein